MENKKQGFTQDNIQFIIKKFQKFGFESLALSDLAVAISIPDFHEQFLRQTGQDWNHKFETKALEKLQKAHYDMQWLMEKEKEHLKPLFEACKKGDLAKVKQYITTEDNPEDLKTTVNHQSKTLLHVAVENGHSVLVEFLLMQGFNPNSRDRYLNTPLHIAALKGYEYIAEVLIQYQCNVKDQDGNGRTAFHYACSSPSSQILHLIIGYEPDVINIPDNNELTGLHYAILNSSTKQIELIRTILENGGNVNARDNQGKTSLYYASEHGKTRVIPILIQKGADIAIPDFIQQKTPLDVACNQRTRELLIVYTTQQNNPKPDDLEWMSNAVKGVKQQSNKQGLFSTIEPQIQQNQTQQMQQSGQQFNKTQQKSQQNTKMNAKEKGQTQQMQVQQQQQQSQILQKPEDNLIKKVVDQDKNTMSTLSRERFFHMMKQIQEEGVKAFQHVKKPFIYTGSWMEGINSMEELYGIITEITSTEACLCTFNLLCPYDKPLPQDPNQEVVGKMYGDAWKTALEQPLKEKRERELKIQAQLEQVEEIKFKLEFKDKQLKEKIAQNKTLIMENESLKVKVEEIAGSGGGGGGGILSKDAEEKLKELESQNQQLTQQIGKLQQQLKIKDQEMRLLNELKEGDGDDKQMMSKNLQELAQLRENLRVEKQRNKEQRFNSGQMFLKVLAERPQKKRAGVAGSGVDNLQDDKAIMRMLMALKNNPPNYITRLQNVSKKDNMVNQDEFMEFCKQLKLPQQDIMSLCRICKFLEGKKYMGIQEFKQILEDRPQLRQEAEERLFKKIIEAFQSRNLDVDTVFQLLDTDKNGEVSSKELRQGLVNLKIIFNQKDLNNIFEVFDKDGSDSISLQEMKDVLDEFKKRLEGKFLGDEEELNEAPYEGEGDGEIIIENEQTKLIDMEYLWKQENMELMDEAAESLSKKDRINGQLKVGIPYIRKSLVSPNSKIHLISKLEGCPENYNNIIQSDDKGNLSSVLKFTINNKLPDEIGDYLRVYMYSGKEQTQYNYIGEIYVYWKACVLHQDKWRISKEFSIVNSDYKTKEVKGFLAVQIKYVPQMISQQTKIVELQIQGQDDHPRQIKVPEELSPINLNHMNIDNSFFEDDHHNLKLSKQQQQKKSQVKLDSSNIDDILDKDEENNFKLMNKRSLDNLDSNFDENESNIEGILDRSDKIGSRELENLEINSNFE